MARRAAAIFGLALAGPGAAGAENPAEAVELGRIDVVGTTPVPGLGVPIDRVPANVQIIRRDSRDRSATLPDFLDRNAASAVLSSGQGNPFQPDLAYRGFTASPLLGLPQGLAVFQDGVRINELFGDVVNWDLIPASAIGSIQLIPGTTPVFGPNTLGGALAVYTKSGSEHPGGAVEISGGSWARRGFQIEHGGSRGTWDWFGTATFMQDDGWAEHNPSRVKQLFAKLGHQTEKSDLDVSLTLADNRLEGAQTLPMSFLDDIRQPYTWPDINTNKVAMLALKGSRFLENGALLGATAFVRRYRNENFSSNVNAEADGDAPEATNDLANIDQTSYGGGVQLTWPGKLGGRDNQILAGITADAGRTRFTRSVQPARFTGSRGTEALGPFEQATDADTRTSHYGVYASDTWSASDRWTLTLSARHDIARVEIADRSGLDPQLDASHRFSRLNPAAGVNFLATPRLTFYAGYSEGMRAPTAMELTCADPQDPCKLPNAFLADPPLRKIVARNIEGGARGSWGEKGTWSAAIFRTALDDDIQFVSSGAGGTAGFFRNVGETRRVGLELIAAGRIEAWDVSMRYGLVDATFRTPFAVRSPDNSSADSNGDILVSPADRIPNVPRHLFKLKIDYARSESWSVGGSVRAASAVFVRGDENNRDAQGPIPGYAVVDFSARWSVTRDLEILGRIENAFDVRYAGQGLLGSNVFNGPGHTFDPAHPLSEQFRGMGAPRGGWVALRYRWP
jgi:outer membrane receptor protein involved in Fe transport